MDQQGNIEAIGLLVKENTPLTWVFAGDSITQGAMHTHGFRSFVELCSEHIRWELRRSMDIVINSGVDGSTTEEMLRDFSWLIQRFDPHVVLLMIGTNDCKGQQVPLHRFEENLRTFLTKVKDAGAIAVLQTPSLIALDEAQAAPSGSRESIVQYVEAVRSIALETATVLIDHWTHWEQAAFADPEILHAKWLDDPIHPGAQGHVVMARLIMKTLSL